MNVTSNLIREIRSGNVVLVLGAGASYGAKNAKGEDPPNAKRLASLLTDRFLSPVHHDKTLPVVAELSISESGDIFAVQEYIREVFIDFQPALFHRLLPSFKWFGIATTNFDLIIERAYQAYDHEPIPELVPCIKNGDRVDNRLRSANSLVLLKLHGCITCTNDRDVPLILSTDQYITHKKGRERLFGLR